MKKWTIVIEITECIDEIYDEPDAQTSKALIEQIVNERLSGHLPPDFSFQIFETIEAPYGPQHPGGVFICDSGRKGNFRQ